MTISSPRDLTPIQVETIFEQDPYQGVAIVAVETNRFLWVNQKYAEILGYSADQLVGTAWTSITMEDDRAHDLAMVRRVLDPNDVLQNYTMKKKYRDPYGLPVPVEINVHGVLDQDRNVLVFLVRCVDIDPLKMEPMRSMALNMMELSDQLELVKKDGTTAIEGRIGKFLLTHWGKVLSALTAFLGGFAALLYSIV
jgi:PAS domain S-box-containing protein